MTLKPFALNQRVRALPSYSFPNFFFVILKCFCNAVTLFHGHANKVHCCCCCIAPVSCLSMLPADFTMVKLTSNSLLGYFIVGG